MHTHGQCLFLFSPFNEYISNSHRFHLVPKFEVNRELHFNKHYQSGANTNNTKASSKSIFVNILTKYVLISIIKVPPRFYLV